MVFEDTIGDLKFEKLATEDVPGADIAYLYMGYDLEYIHGEIVCNGPLENGYYNYNIKLSYSPTQPDSTNSLRVYISLENNNIQEAVLMVRFTDEYGYSYWEYLDSVEAEVLESSIRFRIYWWSIPYYINGRYLSIDSSWGYEMWDIQAEDENSTQIQIGPAGALSGTVSYNGFIGAPIYIQAFTDLNEPDDSIVASTMITSPGSYQLQGIGLGWEGYVRAFTPLFDLNITDLDAMTIESKVRVSQRYPQISNVNLTLQNPVVLQQNVWSSGQLDTSIISTDVYAFDAIEGRISGGV